MNLKKCQIFTPHNIVTYMLDLILDNQKIYGKSFIDNSCGDGAFLTEIVERYISTAKKKSITNKNIKMQLEHNIVGYDIDNHYVEQCIENLNKVSNKYNIKNVKWSVKCLDSLYIDENRKFDFVIGNPPYVAYKDLDKKTREEIKNSFETCSFGKWDYSYAFIEKGLRLLNPNGRMIYITPSNMFKTVFGEKLRNYMKPYISHIINFPVSRIFKNVLTSPAITIFNKGNYTNIIIYKEILEDKTIIERIINKENLSNKWNFNINYDNGDNRFGDYFMVSNSVATLANNIFVHNVMPNGEIEIDVEEKILRPAASPKSLHYSISQKIIFPYYYENQNICKYSYEGMKKRFPKAFGYLNYNRDRLDSRDSDKNAKFYEYGRSQALAHLNQRKLLLSPIITKKVKIYELDEKTIPYSGVYIVPKNDLSLEAAKIILETENFYHYVESKGINVNGKSLRISTKEIEEYRF